MDLSLDLDTLATAYASSKLTPLDLIDELLARFRRTPHEGLLIGGVCEDLARSTARSAMQRRARGEHLPLFGVPFVIKDSLDVAGLPTTVACPAFAYHPTRHAAVVERLLAAGAIPIAKTNLDQFATGLVGVRSPYGIPENPFDARYISGGSSSGSAGVVARGLASFALGTDTAGSGRVPAAFNNVVGLKPTRGMLSVRGLVPACRSFDCVSVFALTVDDAAEVAHVLAGGDPEDPYLRPEAATWDPRPGSMPSPLRVGVPQASQLEFDESESAALFAHAVAAIEASCGPTRELDFTPFFRASALLYGSAFVAERLEAAGALLARDPEAFHPAVRTIFEGGLPYRASDAAAAHHELQILRAAVEPIWSTTDLLIVPTTPAIYRIEQVLRDPIALNQRLGRYASFANLLDLCALAIPAGFHANGLPFGVTLLARRGRDSLLSSVGRRLHAALVQTLGATGRPLPPLRPVRTRSADRAALAVVGAHLSGQPLNRELTDLGARLLCATQSAPHYRLFALPTTPPKPGLVRVAPGETGHAIELEVWELDNAALGTFMRGVRGPLCIGTVELKDGSQVLGFLCETSATAGQREISSLGGWRAFRKQLG
jgi:allophanate hydrolase